MARRIASSFGKQETYKRGQGLRKHSAQHVRLSCLQVWSGLVWSKFKVAFPSRLIPKSYSRGRLRLYVHCHSNNEYANMNKRKQQAQNRKRVSQTNMKLKLHKFGFKLKLFVRRLGGFLRFGYCSFCSATCSEAENSLPG